MEFQVTPGMFEYWLIALVFTIASFGASYDAYKLMLKRFPDDPVLKRSFRFLVFLVPMLTAHLFLNAVLMNLAV